MIILSVGIAGQLKFGLWNALFGGVIERYANDGFEARHQQTWVESLVGVVVHVVHFRVAAFIEPSFYFSCRIGVYGTCLSYSAGKKAETLCLDFYFFRKLSLCFFRKDGIGFFRMFGSHWVGISCTERSAEPYPRRQNVLNV